LIGLDQYREAQREIEIAIDEAPDLAEFYRTRATLRAKLKQSDGLAGDLRHFELLSHLLPRAFWGGPLALAHETAGQATAPSVGFPASIDPAPRVRDRAYEPGAEGSTVPASIEELEARASLATTIREAGERDLAAAELGKILLLEPDHIGVRMTRAIQALEAGRLDDAWPDLQTVMAHPGLAAYLREEPLIFKRLHEPSHRSLLCLLRDASRYYCRNGRLEEGRAIARRALDLDIELDQPRGMSHFNLARACAESARSDPTSPYVEEAANHLFRAFVAHPGYQAKYKHESTFDAVRVWIDASLNLKADSRELHQRKLAVRSPLKGR
jgi:tetratricopeptide (TPR) repeat protein